MRNYRPVVTISEYKDKHICENLRLPVNRALHLQDNPL